MVFDRNTKFAFGKISRNYEKFREGYPKKLFNDIVTFANLKIGDKVLEIGCGTGKATVPFVKSGFSVTGLDVNKELIDEAVKKTSKFKNIKYLHSSFEEVKLPPNSFSLIFAAQAWHWIDPRIGYTKMNRLLKRNGVFAVFSKTSEDRNSKISRTAHKLYTKYCPKYPGNVKKTNLNKDISKTKSFGPAIKKEYNTNIRFTKRQLLGLISTYSWVADLNKDKRQRLFREFSKLFDGEKEPFIVPYKYTLFMYKKVK